MEGGTLYKKYFRNGNVDHIGYVNRFTKMSQKEIANNSLARFARENDLDIPSTYRMVKSNMEAGFQSISKYDKQQPVLDEVAWHLAGDWTTRHWQPYMCGARVLDADVCIQQMDRTTSPGQPWVNEHHTKNEFLENAKMKMVLQDFWDVMAGKNVDRIVPLWGCSQKVEMRSVVKLAENNHRTFNPAPFELSLATNRLCLDMNNRFYDSANRTWSFVGSSKFLCGWDRMYDRLNKHPHAYELDESQYDSSLFARALYGQRDIRWGYLSPLDKTDENKNRMDGVYDSIVHSVIVLENGELIQKHTGNPSGSSNTVVDNTMILFRLKAYAWILLIKARGEDPDYDEFVANVEAALYGDDNTFTVSEDFNDMYNVNTIAPIWSSIGVITKSPCNTSRRLEEVSFLSNGFYYDKRNAVWMPVPETGKVLSSLMWGSSVDDVRWHYLRACALRIDSYGNLELRNLLSRYISFVDKHYSSQMVGEINGVKIEHIRGVWKSDGWIQTLYAGKESVISSNCDADLNSLLLVLNN